MNVSNNSCPLASEGCLDKLTVEEFTLSDGSHVHYCEECDLLWAQRTSCKYNSETSTEDALKFNQWLLNKQSWHTNSFESPHSKEIEKISSKRVILHDSLSHQDDPTALLESIEKNIKIKELGILIHNASSREAIHCGSYWPIWEEQARYFFSPTTIKMLMEPTSFQLKASYPVEFLMYENTMKVKKASHPKTAFWRGRVRSLIHRIGGRLNTDDAGHIFYLFSRNI